MHITRNLAPVLALVYLAACGGGETQGTEPSPPPIDPQQTGQLPSGHPPIAESSPGLRVAEPAPGSGTGQAGMAWDVPGGWVSVPPTSSMRRAQYVVSGDGGDAECVAYYFGPGQGGDAQSNALRWADQFAQSDGSSSRDVMQTREIDVEDFKVLLVDVSGIYSGGMAMMGGEEKSLTDYRLLGAIAEGPDANWFFKFTGPDPTVASQQQAFEAMIRSLRRGGGA